ncbi:PhzF family phenazine biosynthesis protein [Microbacterium candidum]|uniref:PhzF family phenazine biosynthesis protein n=1 Tax=Microbacterium candidum TaxID=3041922 RepID=A0ABT7MYU2_9MICO|nr:PhzF family phenazine biosynthesis protein [Microbacterium sp. ASV49]MDL9979616.1 PhzF family phenazine biosynthesis protein [Microbacterium sp. ASV49]
MSTEIPILHMTAFADGPTGGNPAGVVPDASALTESGMQTIAARLGYPESAFIVDPAVDEDRRHLRIRYFSPGAEVPFCGHATIAAAVLLATDRGVGEFTFETAVGPIVIDTQMTTGGEVTASFTSVSPLIRELQPDVAEELLGLLGLTPADLDDDLPLRESFAGNWHPIVAIREQGTFDAFTFDPARVRLLMDAQGWTGTVTVVHAITDAFDDFEARNPFPVGAITEDPATGSAAASLGAYLRAMNKVAPPARLTIHQGRHVGRPSILKVDIPADGGITVTGTADIV